MLKRVKVTVVLDRGRFERSAADGLAVSAGDNCAGRSQQWDR